MRPLIRCSWSRLVCAALLSAASLAWPASVSAQAPRLIVVLVIDQFRADYIETYGSHWTGGLRRLLDEGAWFTQAAYPYYNTVTCAGHSTIATGSFPATHGMIANSWWDRETARRVRCTFVEQADLAQSSNPSACIISAFRIAPPAAPRTVLCPSATNL